MNGLVLYIFLTVSMLDTAQLPGLVMVPSVSPDGSKIAFVSQGDIWIVPSEGGTAIRLTDNEGIEYHPMWSPDGKWIAFVGESFGNFDIYVMPSDGSSPPKRLTYFSNYERPIFWSADSRYIFFRTTRTELRGAVYKVSIDGGLPEKVIDYSIIDGVRIPNTDTMLFFRGPEDRYRRKYRGSGDWDIWISDTLGKNAKRLTEFDGKDGWPMYSPVTGKIYFVSDRGPDSVSNLWVMDIDGSNPKQLTFFKDDVVYPDMSLDGKLIAFTVLGELYTYSIPDGKISKPKIKLQTMDLKTNGVIYKTLYKGVKDFAVSPDGSELAFVVFGDIFVMHLENGSAKEIKRITFTPEPETDVSWHPTEEKLIFISLRDGDWDIYTIKPKDADKFYEAFEFETQQVLDTEETEESPIFSPDGSKIMFRADHGRIFVMNSDGTDVKKIVDEPNCNWPTWSPDGNWIAYSREGWSWREDVFVVPSDGSGKPINISNHYNDDYKPMWSKDGRRLVFASRTDKDELFLKYVFLQKEDAERDTSYWREALDTLTEARPIKIDTEGISKRVKTLAKFKGKYNGWTQTPDGKTIIIHTQSGDTSFIAVLDWFGEVKNSIKLKTTRPSNLQITEGGSRLFFKDKDGVIYTASTFGSGYQMVSFSVNIEMPESTLRRVLFTEAWWLLNDLYYDPEFHGVDWKALYHKYLPIATRTRTYEEFNEVIRMMLGELNSSHLGVWRERSLSERMGEELTGCIGIVPDPSFKGNGVRVKEVIPNTPADKKLHLKEGDVIVAINGIRIEKPADFYRLMRRKAKEKVKLEFLRGGAVRDTGIVQLLTPWALRDTIYWNWVEANRRIVDSLSNGRIGYIHLRGMGYNNLKEFYEQLYPQRDKEGLIIDVRFNGGGRVHDELLKFLSRVPYAYTSDRGDTVLRVEPEFRWDKPTVVMINEYSFSDAEIFPMGFKQLGLGKLVGVPTFGGVIGTINVKLMDNQTTFRIPLEGWYRLDKTSLENKPVEPDVYVENPPDYDNKPGGPQLEKAVEVVLKMIEEQTKGE